MNLIKKEKIENPTSKSDSHSHHEDEKTETVKSKNADTLYLPEDKQRLIGIKTTKVEILDLSKKILAYSTVAYDPELYTAILEYREAKKATQLLADETSSSSNSLLNSSIVRLKQLGLSDSAIIIILVINCCNVYYNKYENTKSI
jgi:Cu(I)/Ag(I) efflux system membrane fusion protein